jgi:hypothetical protein
MELAFDDIDKNRRWELMKKFSAVKFLSAVNFFSAVNSPRGLVKFWGLGGPHTYTVPEAEPGAECFPPGWEY